MIFLWEEKIDPIFISHYFKGINIEKLLFFDIETTGLNFTKSNLIFLLGLGYIFEDKFLIKQFILEEEEKEVDIYNLLHKEFETIEVLFTYNGEKFDIPLLINRLKMYNKEEIIESINKLSHIDLLKFARKLWKPKIGSCSLGNVEKKVLNIHREDDLPGFMVPSFFKIYLREKNLKYLKKIMEHNRQDILSLYYILEHIIREDIKNGKKRISISAN